MTVYTRIVNSVSVSTRDRNLSMPRGTVLSLGSKYLSQDSVAWNVICILLNTSLVIFMSIYTSLSSLLRIGLPFSLCCHDNGWGYFVHYVGFGGESEASVERAIVVANTAPAKLRTTVFDC